ADLEDPEGAQAQPAAQRHRLEPAVPRAPGEAEGRDDLRDGRGAAGPPAAAAHQGALVRGAQAARERALAARARARRCGENRRRGDRGFDPRRGQVTLYSGVMRALALVLAAGQGVRLGRDVPKGFVRVRGRTLLEWSAAALARSPEVGAIQCVLPPGVEAERVPGLGEVAWLSPVTGGARRQDSV